MNVVDSRHDEHVTMPAMSAGNPMVDIAVGEGDGDASPLKADPTAITEFLEFLDKNKASLKSGMGAFHTDNHSNW